MEDFTLSPSDWSKIRQLYKNNPEFPRLPEDTGYTDGLQDILNHLNSYHPTEVDDITQEQLLLPFATLILLRNEYQVSIHAMLSHLTMLGQLYLTRNVSFDEIQGKEWTDEEVQEVMSRDSGLVTQGLWLTEVISLFTYSVIQSTEAAEVRE